MKPVSKILVAVDFSKGSTSAVEYAIALAKELRSTVALVHVCQAPDLMSSIVPGADRVLDAAKDRDIAAEGLDKLRVDALAREQVDVEVLVLVEEGAAAPAIIALSATGRFDLIVMGTHGRTGLRHLLMGSVAEAVVRGARCPVLTIHLPASESGA